MTNSLQHAVLVYVRQPGSQVKFAHLEENYAALTADGWVPVKVLDPVSFLERLWRNKDNGEDMLSDIIRNLTEEE